MTRGNPSSQSQPLEWAGKTAWAKVVDDAHVLAEERRSRGWTVLEIEPLQTIVERPEAAAEVAAVDIVQRIPEDAKQMFERWAQTCRFVADDIYSEITGCRVCFVSEFRDPDRTRMVFIPGCVPYSAIASRRNPGLAENRIGIHIEGHDETHLGTWYHADCGDAFQFPDSRRTPGVRGGKRGKECLDR